MGDYPRTQLWQDFQQRMALLKVTLICLIYTTVISAAPREIRSYNICGASWLKVKCPDCSSSGQQCTEWTLQQCKKCNLGPKAELNNHKAGHAGHIGNHHYAGNHNLNKDNNINGGNNNNGGFHNSNKYFRNPNAGNYNNGGNNQRGNNNTGDNNGSTNSGNTNSGNTNSGNGSNNKGDNNGNTITNSNNTNTVVNFNIS